MLVKLCGITEAKAHEIADKMGYGFFTLKHIEDAGDNLYNMPLPDTYVNVNIKQQWITIHRHDRAMHINEDEFYKLEVL